MKIPKGFAAAAFTVVFLCMMGSVAGAGGITSQQTVSPAATESRAETAPGQSLRELLGQADAGAKALIDTGVWGLSENTEVYGATCLEEGATLYLQGHTLTINGDLTLGGTLNVNGGKLIVKGNLAIENGLLVMSKSADYVEVSKAMIACGGDETGKLTAGSVKVLGDFLQMDTCSIYSYNETGSHATTFGGSNKLAQFFSPLGSGIRNPTILAGTSFTSSDRTIAYQRTFIDTDGKTKTQSCSIQSTGGTFLSLTKALTANYSVAVPNLYFMGSQGKWTLTVTGNLIVPQGAEQAVTGNCSAMRVTVDGTLAVNAGTVSAQAFDAYGDVNLNGGAVTVSDYYCRHATAEGDSLLASASGSPVTVRKDTAAQFTAGAPSLELSGRLGGRRVSLSGSMAIPAGATLSIDGGRLDVSGAMTAKGRLAMRSRADSVIVGGDFAAEGEDSRGDLTDGFLVLKGSFAQTVNSKSFEPESALVTMLMGGAGQTVSFQHPAAAGSADGSWFGALVNCNPSATFLTQYGSASYADSGTKLTGIAVSAGAAPLPLCPAAFDGNTLNYSVAVPEDAPAVFIASTMQQAGEKIETMVNGAPLAGDGFDGNDTIAVDPAGATVVTLYVMTSAGEPYEAAGEPFGTQYTLTLQPENAKLTSPGFSYETDKPFDGNATDYAVTVPIGDAAFSLSPVLANPNASYRFVCAGQQFGGASFTRALHPGESVETDVVVTAYQSPSASEPVTRTYRFTFRRQALLGGIGLSGGAQANEPLAWNTFNYTVDLPAAAWAVTVAPAWGDGCALCTAADGSPLDSVELRPDFGGSATATFVLADASGANRQTYTVTARRAALLSGISIRSATSGGTISAMLKPAFSGAVHSYTAYVPVNAAGVTISGDKLPGCTGLIVGGQPDEYATAIAAGGHEDIALTASAGSGDLQKSSYAVRLSKPLITGITLSAGSLDAPFDPESAGPAHITIPYAKHSVLLTPAVNDNGAGLVTLSYSEGGGAIAGSSSTLLTLSQGQTRTIEIKASYQGVDKTYAVSVCREKSDNADLKSLGAGNGWLSPAFSPSTASYTLLLPDLASSVKIAPVAADSNSKYRIDTLAANTAKTVSLPINGAATVKITITALRGNTKTYTVTVRRVPMVPSFSGSPVRSGYPSLTPGGAARLTFSYKLAMPATVKIEVKKGGKWYTVLSRNESASGTKSYAWNGKAGGKYLGYGVYSVRITPYWRGLAGTQKTIKIKIIKR